MYYVFQSIINEITVKTNEEICDFCNNHSIYLLINVSFVKLVN